MTKSLDASIVTQAIKDLVHDKKSERLAALQFFLANGHRDLCERAGLNQEEITNSVKEISMHDGVRRDKLVKELLDDISEN